MWMDCFAFIIYTDDKRAGVDDEYIGKTGDFPNSLGS